MQIMFSRSNKTQIVHFEGDPMLLLLVQGNLNRKGLTISDYEKPRWDHNTFRQLDGNSRLNGPHVSSSSRRMSGWTMQQGLTLSESQQEGMESAVQRHHWAAGS